MQRALYAVLGLVGSVAPVGITAEDTKSELEGTWELVSIERDPLGRTPTRPSRRRGDPFRGTW